MFSGPNLAGWDQTLKSADTQDKANLPFTQAMQDEVEDFYFSHYVIHFSQVGGHRCRVGTARSAMGGKASALCQHGCQGVNWQSPGSLCAMRVVTVLLAARGAAP